MEESQLWMKLIRPTKAVTSRISSRIAIAYVPVAESGSFGMAM